MVSKTLADEAVEQKKRSIIALHSKAKKRLKDFRDTVSRCDVCIRAEGV